MTEENPKHKVIIEETIDWKDPQAEDPVGTWKYKETIPLIDKDTKKLIGESINTSIFYNAKRSALAKNLVVRSVTIRKLTTQRDQALENIKTCNDAIKREGLSRVKTSQMVRLQKDLQSLKQIETIGLNRIEVQKHERDITAQEEMIKSRNELLATGKTTNLEDQGDKEEEVEEIIMGVDTGAGKDWSAEVDIDIAAQQSQDASDQEESESKNKEPDKE